METSSLRTVAFVSGDPVLTERIRASLRRGPFRFRPASPGDLDPADDLRVVPAPLPPSLDPGLSGIPVIAYGPAPLLREAFLLGCADYLKDPWSPEELCLRALRALERDRAGRLFPWGELSLEGCALRTPFGSLTLGVQEAVMLRLLLRHRGGPVPREALHAVAAGGPMGRGSRVVDVRICSLRRNLAAVLPPGGLPIRCVRRQGYAIP